MRIALVFAGMALLVVGWMFIRGRVDEARIAAELPGGRYPLSFFEAEVLGVCPLEISVKFGVNVPDGLSGSLRTYENLALRVRASGEPLSYLLVEGRRAILLLCKEDKDKIDELWWVRMASAC